MARALAHSSRYHPRHFPRYHLSSQAQHRQGAQDCHAPSVVLRTVASCFDSVHLICRHLTIFTLLQITDPHRTKRGNNAPHTHIHSFSLRLPPFVEKRVGAFLVFLQKLTFLFCMRSVFFVVFLFFTTFAIETTTTQTKQRISHFIISFPFVSYNVPKSPKCGATH